MREPGGQVVRADARAAPGASSGHRATEWPCVRNLTEPISAHHAAVSAGRTLAAQLNARPLSREPTGHARARFHDNQRALTVNHGSSHVRGQRIHTSKSSQVDHYRSSKLVILRRWPRTGPHRDLVFGTKRPTRAHGNGRSGASGRWHYRDEGRGDGPSDLALSA